jgi:photosystem II stability/assembly factor-like uncharacterized protein
MKIPTAECILCIGLLFSFADITHGKWIPANGIWELTVLNLAVSENTFFAGTYYGLLRSRDNGTTWTRCNFGLPNTTVFALAACDTTIFAGFAHGLFRSTDNGASWTNVSTLLSPYTKIMSLGVHGSTIFTSASTLTGVISYNTFRSIDNGETWVEVDSSFTKRVFQSFTVSGNTLFAGGMGLFRSSDNGKTWTSVLADKPVCALGAQGPLVLAGTMNNDICYSIDTGSSWTCVPLVSGITSAQAFGFFGNTIIAGTNNGTLCSNDSGRSWIAANPVSSDISCFGVNGSVAVASTKSGIFVSSDNGKNWNASNAGLAASAINSLAASGTTIIAGTNNGIFLSTSNGTDWAPPIFGNTLLTIFALALSGGKIFAGLYGGISVSTDNGTTWVRPANSGLPSYFDKDKKIEMYYDLTCLAVQGNTLFAVNNDSMYRSDDYGASWSSVSRKCNTLLALSTDTIFAGTDSGGIYRSTDRGANWTAVNSRLTQLCIVSLASSHGFIFAGTSCGIFRSGDNGESWTACDSGVTDTAVLVFTVCGDALFAGTKSEGIFLSTDNGLHWTAVNDGLSIGYPVISLVANNGTLFAGSRVFGVWHRPLSEMLETTDARPVRETPDRMQCTIATICHNSSAVAIEFAISHRVPVTIDMYNPTGRAMASLINRYLDAGHHRFSWDMHTYARGCYVVRIRAGSATYTKPVYLVH